MQTIHYYNGSYPFGHEEGNQNAFMQIYKVNLQQNQILDYKNKCQLYKQLNNNNNCFIKFIKILKEDQNLHIIFEYISQSYKGYIQKLSKSLVKLNRQKYKQLEQHFKAQIQNAIKILSQNNIKSQIYFSNIGYQQQIKQLNNKIKIKFFIQPQFEIINSKISAHEPKNISKQQSLNDFYLAEKKRLLIQFQELIQRCFGKLTDQQDKKNIPNFVINGTKLVFIKQPEKIQKKIMPQEQQNEIINKIVQDNKKKKIVNFDQSFQPQFKPQQFTKQNTYILQQTQYLQSLQQQMKTFAFDKKTEKNSKNSIQSNSEKQTNKFSPTNRKNTAQKIQLQTQNEKTKQIQNRIKIISQNNSHNSNNCPANNSSNSDSYQLRADIEQKTQKNKYKMKIITSHQVQIQGCQSQVSNIKKQIIQGLKNGKITVNQLTSNRDYAKNIHKIQTNVSKQIVKPKEDEDSQSSKGQSNYQKKSASGSSKEVIKKNELSQSGFNKSQQKQSSQDRKQKQQNIHDRIYEAKLKAEKYLKNTKKT